MITQDRGLALLDEFVAEGRTLVSSRDVALRLGVSAQSASNVLRRLMREGLLDRVGRGRYVIRALGVLGTPAAAEDLATAVGAAFSGIPHRIAYRSALDELELLVHPARTITVASTQRVRQATLSRRPLSVVLERKDAIHVGAEVTNSSWVSSVERALLDAAARPRLVGGATVLAEAITAAGRNADPERITSYAAMLGWGAALRRIGSIADRLKVDGLAGRLSPLRSPTSDVDLDPSRIRGSHWRDSRWWVRWMVSPAELGATR